MECSWKGCVLSDKYPVEMHVIVYDGSTLDGVIFATVTTELFLSIGWVLRGYPNRIFSWQQSKFVNLFQFSVRDIDIN